MNGQFLTAHGVRLIAILAVALAAGCGGSDNPRKFKVSGTIDYGGKPLPSGVIYFEPDGTKGNSGPAGGGEISNGRYETYPDRGVQGGAYVVRIEGSDGKPFEIDGETQPHGAVLFANYQEKVDLPQADSVQNFSVPRTHK